MWCDMTEVLKFVKLLGKVVGGGGGGGSMGSGLFKIKQNPSEFRAAVNSRDLRRHPMSYCFAVSIVDNLRIAGHASHFEHGEGHRLHWGNSIRSGCGSA